MNVARALSFQASLPLNLCNFAIQHSIHLIIRIPTPLLKDNSPYQILFKEPLILMHLKVFCCLSYASIVHANKTKIYPRARKYAFQCYTICVNGFIL